MKGIRSLLARLDRYQRSHPFLGFPFGVAKKFGQDRAGAGAALIAYYGFLSLFPLLLVLVTILGFVLHGDLGLQERIISSAKKEFPSLSDYLKTGSIHGSGVALTLGLAGALWAGLGVARTAGNAMNSVWDVPFFERGSFAASRVRALGLLATLGSALLVSTALSVLRGIHGPLAPLFWVAGLAGPVLVNAGLYAVAFRVLTSIHLTWRDVLPGAILGALSWTALQIAGNYFVRHQIAHASHLYGTLAVVIGLLAWIHLGAQLTLYAAEINVVRIRHLWPRSLTGDDLTDADRRAMEMEVSEVRRYKDRAIQV